MATVRGREIGRVVLVHEHVTGGGLAGRELPGSWAVEGSAMRRALARDFAAVAGVRVVMTLDDRLPDEPGPWTIARIGPGGPSEAIPNLAARADHTVLVAPETDGVLRDLALAIAHAGGSPLGSTPEAIDLAADKSRLAAFLTRAGIPTPATQVVRPHEGLPRDAAYPAVLKPIDGAGSVDTLLVESSDDPIARTFPGEVGLFQPFLDGEPRSATFLARPGDAPLLLGVGRQEISRSLGRFVYEGGTLLDEPLPFDHPTRLAVSAIEGLAGLVGVDYIQDPEGSNSVVIEINPRPTTSCVGLVAALGPGCLAAAWIGAQTGMRANDRASAGFYPLARPNVPLRFLSDGTIVRDVGGRV